MGLPYTIFLRPDEEGDVVAKVQELTGCVAHGTDEREALDNLKEVQRVWLEDCIESGQPVPEPETEEHLPSGKWVQRVPRTLHKRLSKLAEHEHVSRNQLVTAMLTEALASRTWIKDAREPTHSRPSLGGDARPLDSAETQPRLERAGRHLHKN